MSDPFSYSRYILHPEAILHNIKLARSCLKPNTKIIAMVKADAYSVGVEVVASIIKNSVDAFAVANLEEGIKLRNLGILNEIFVMAPINLEFLSVYSYYNLAPTITSISELNKMSSETKMPIKVQIKVDSGLARFGISKISEFRRVLAKIKSNKKITLLGVFSHLATKQENTKFIYHQKRRFEKFVNEAKLMYGENLYYHLANSNAVFNHSGLGFNAVRMGFGLFGMDKNLHKKLRPFISIKSKIVSLKTINKNASVGYDRTFIANRKMKIAIVPLGYADGVDRRLSNKGFVLIDGCRANIVGRVSMDSFMVDVSDIKNVTVGSDVTIIGKEKREIITLQNIACLSDASPYEILVKFSNKRMKIEYD